MDQPIPLELILIVGGAAVSFLMFILVWSPAYPIPTFWELSSIILSVICETLGALFTFSFQICFCTRNQIDDRAGYGQRGHPTYVGGALGWFQRYRDRNSRLNEPSNYL